MRTIVRGSPRIHGGVGGGWASMTLAAEGGQRVIGPPQRAGNLFVGRNQRSVTRALLAYGKEFTTAELLRFMYPRWALEQLLSWHWKSGQAGCRELRDGARSPAPEASAMARDPGKEPLAAQGVSHSGRSCAAPLTRAFFYCVVCRARLTAQPSSALARQTGRDSRPARGAVNKRGHHPGLPANWEPSKKGPLVV